MLEALKYLLRLFICSFADIYFIFEHDIMFGVGNNSSCSVSRLGALKKHHKISTYMKPNAIITYYAIKQVSYLVCIEVVKDEDHHTRNPSINQQVPI